MTEIHEANLLVQEADRRVSMAHTTLLSEARALAQRMTKLADRLEREGMSTSINGLGELQEQRLNIDRACALFCDARAAHNLILRAVRAARTERPR